MPKAKYIPYRLRKSRKAPNRTCITCGTQFYLKPCMVTRGRGKFCSRDCRSEFQAIHFPAVQRERWRDPALRERMRTGIAASNKRFAATSFGRQALAARCAESVIYWSDPANRKRRAAQRRGQTNSPAARAKISANVKAAWTDPEKRARMGKQPWLPPVEYLDTFVRMVKQMGRGPAQRKLRAMIAAGYKSPEEEKRLRTINANARAKRAREAMAYSEVRERISIAAKVAHAARRRRAELVACVASASVAFPVASTLPAADEAENHRHGGPVQERESLDGAACSTN